MNDSLTAAYTLTRMMNAFAAQYISATGNKIKEMHIEASGLTSYDPMAIKMAAAAGIAQSYGKLNGKGDLPALGFLQKEGIDVYATEKKGARPGLASRVSVNYRLEDGVNILFQGEIEPTETGGIAYTLKTVDGFSGKGIPLMATQYVVSEHPDIPGQIGRFGSMLGNEGFNITHLDLMGRNHGAINRLITSAVAGDKTVGGTLLNKINAETGAGSRATVVDLRNYHSS
jgi:hypothetical protein